MDWNAKSQEQRQRLNALRKRAKELRGHEHEIVHSPSAYLSAPNIGVRKLQLIHASWRGKPRAWEVRRSDDLWRLYSVEVVSPAPSFQLRGWNEIPFLSADLESYFERIANVKFALGPPRDDIFGIDGSTTQIAAWSGFAEWRFQWWRNAPPEWRPLIEIAVEMRKAFTNAVRAYKKQTAPTTRRKRSE